MKKIIIKMIFKKLLKMILIIKKIIQRFSLHTAFHGMMVLCSLFNSFHLWVLFMMIYTVYYLYVYEKKWSFSYKGNNKITELRTILQRESQNS